MSASTILDGDLPRETVTAPLLSLVAVLLLAVPLFLRLPLTNDAEVYDLQASLVRDGGVLYRDLLEPNLPGVVAVHLGVRALLGDSSEALRLFDLGLFGAALAAAGWIVRLAGGSLRASLWGAVGLAACYLSMSEWCHCQRDLWMLPPALTALGLRLRGVLRPQSVWWSLVEGVLWGLAVWLKPYVIVPAAAIWLVSFCLQSNWRTWCLSAVACLTGGVVIGGMGVSIMVGTGCWGDFLDTVRHWNPAYFAAGRAHWSWGRWLGAILRMSPWSLLHVFALGVALRAIWQQVRRTRTHQSASPRECGTMLVAALYGGWSFQALALQHQFDYVFAPTVLLALLLLIVAGVGIARRLRGPSWTWLAFGLVVLASSPLTDWQRLQHWPACVRGSVTAAVRDQLMQFQNPSQQDLGKVAEFLRGAEVADRDVCFYNSDFVSLYRQLGLKPPVRYTYLFETLQFFPDRREAILTELARQPHRYVVTDLVSCGMPRERAEEIGPAGPLAPPPAYATAPQDAFPWSLPVVFRAGTYLVHQVEPRNTEHRPAHVTQLQQ